MELGKWPVLGKKMAYLLFGVMEIIVDIAAEHIHRMNRGGGLQSSLQSIGLDI